MSEENDQVNEPEVGYGLTPANRKITFFNSFEEAEEYGLKEMASHSYAERLKNLEIIRKRTFRHLLLPDGKWPKVERIIIIEKGTLK
jgi:hypothetical protein